MSDKEAIEEIKSMGLIIDAATSGTRRKSIYEALTLAIKALEERPTEDLSEYSDKLWKQAYERGKAEVRPQDEWIPVSERLPEDMQSVLIWFEYYRYGDYNCMYQTYGLCHILDGKWSPFINGRTGWQDARIIAWMPLPEPYKESENE